jgi:hypothetical protein
VSDIGSRGFDELIESVMVRYDEAVRRNTTDSYDALRAVGLDNDGLSGVHGEILDIAEAAGAPIDDPLFHATSRVMSPLTVTPRSYDAC